MRVLFLAAEATPFAKVGGLADVAGELPFALSKRGIDIRVCLPLHSTIDRADFSLREVREVEISRQGIPLIATLYETDLRGVRIWLVDGEPVRAVQGVYHEMNLDAEKFTFVNLAALNLCEELEWYPDILHANDWHAAVAVMSLRVRRETQPKWRRTGSLYTIHNLPYMGTGAEQALEAYGAPLRASRELPGWAYKVPLAQGILQADWVNTVSPTYAEEIQTPDFGSGLEDLLKARQDTLSGILNGIDPAVWDPDKDESIKQVFDVRRLEQRGKNKTALQKELGLAEDSQIPFLGVVSRLDAQKGMDLIWPALLSLMEEPWQLVLLGTGDSALEQRAQDFQASHPERVRALLQFDAGLARRIYAGSDMLLIPSRYEPCGLAQMIAMRYGCVPIVRATGGLVDSVIDVDDSHQGTGFIFHLPTAEAFRDALKRAFVIFGQKDQWEQVQRNGMHQDFSWTQPANTYQSLYQRIGDIHAT